MQIECFQHALSSHPECICYVMLTTPSIQLSLLSTATRPNIAEITTRSYLYGKIFQRPLQTDYACGNQIDVCEEMVISRPFPDSPKQLFPANPTSPVNPVNPASPRASKSKIPHALWSRKLLLNDNQSPRRRLNRRCAFPRFRKHESHQ